MGYFEHQGTYYEYNDSLKVQQRVKEKGIIQFLFLLKNHQKYQIKNHHYEHHGCNPNLQMKHEEQNPSYSRIFFEDEFEGLVVKVDKRLKKMFLVGGDKNRRFKGIDKDLCFDMLNDNKKPYCYMSFNADDIVMNVRDKFQRSKFKNILNLCNLVIPVFPRMGCTDLQKEINPQIEVNENINVQDRLESEESQPLTTCEDVDSDDNMFKFDSNIGAVGTEQNNFNLRYHTMASNIESRRGTLGDIRVPIFRDWKTSYEVTADEPYPGYIYMDHLAYGSGNFALQLTFLGKNMDHARHLHDQLVTMAPIMSAFTAGSSIYKGKLSDWDTKWEILSAALDDRQLEERNTGSLRYIPKSRFSSTSAYLSDSPMCRKEYDDIKVARNEFIMNYAREKSKEFGLEVDEKLLLHLGHLFVRSPLVVQRDKVDVDDSQATNHFDNFQLTNWNSLRFKPPTSQASDDGWKVEFRTAEIQISPDENSAIIILMLRIAQMFYYPDLNLNFYIPISYVDENFRRAKLNNAILKQKFFFRKNVFDIGPAEILQLSTQEIFFGKPECDFIGIMNLIDLAEQRYNKVDQSQLPQERVKSNKAILKKVYKYVKHKSSGKIKTLAQWQRDFVLNHPKYQRDSIVSEEIQFDLIQKILQIQHDRKKNNDYGLNFPI